MNCCAYAFSVVGYHSINWDSMVEGNVYLACQINHTIPFIKSAECNTNDVYHRDTFINFINILRCSLLYFLNRATYDLSKRNPSKVQPMAKITVLPKTEGSPYRLLPL